MSVFNTTLIVLTLMGIIDSLYLIWKHLKKQPLSCPINKDDCNAVVESKYGKILRVKNEYLGLLYYIFILICGFLLAYHIWNSKIFLIIFSSLALVFSIYLTYVQLIILKKYCFYCLVSAIINLLIFVNVAALVFKLMQ